jgi:hypothetical protein
VREEGDGDEHHLNVDDDDGCDGRSIFFVFAENKLSRRRVSVVVDSRRTTTISTTSIDGSFCNIFIFIIVFCFCFVGREDETDVYFFFLG